MFIYLYLLILFNDFFELKTMNRSEHKILFCIKDMIDDIIRVQKEGNYNCVEYYSNQLAGLCLALSVISNGKLNFPSIYQLKQLGCDF